jgi:hypothetical protein
MIPDPPDLEQCAKKMIYIRLLLISRFRIKIVVIQVRPFYEKRMGAEVEGDTLGDEVKSEYFPTLLHLQCSFIARICAFRLRKTVS